MVATKTNPKHDTRSRFGGAPPARSSRLGGERLGDAAADAVAGAGDDRDLALELLGHPVYPINCIG